MGQNRPKLTQILVKNYDYGFFCCDNGFFFCALLLPKKEKKNRYHKKKPLSPQIKVFFFSMEISFKKSSNTSKWSFKNLGLLGFAQNWEKVDDKVAEFVKKCDFLKMLTTHDNAPEHRIFEFFW